jgi:TonB family protein
MTLLSAALVGLLAASAPETGVLTRAPELLAFVPAEYPPDAASAGISGVVTLAIVIGENGDVLQATVVDPGPHPAFAPAALHAVAQFRFRAAELDGVPAAVEIEYRYEFTLEKVEAAATPPAPPPVAEAAPPPPPSPTTAGSARYEAVVRGARAPNEVTVRELAAAQIQTVAGTQGDTLKVVQNLPGVARSPFGIGLLVVRGSDPNDTVVMLDGIPVPMLFHFGGLTSVVSSDVIEGLEFQPGNFGSRFGRALGGAVELRTRDARRETSGLAQVDVFDGRAQLEGALGRGSGYVALRRSWVDAVLAVALPRVAPEAANELRVAPRYYDYQAKVSHPLLGGIASVVAYGADDAMEFVEEGERSGRPTFGLRTLFHRVAARWRGSTGPLGHDLTLAAGRDSFDVLQSDDFGVVTEVRALSIRDAVGWRPSDRFALELGVDTLARRYSYEVYAPPLASPGAFGSPVADVPLTVGERASGTWLAPGAWLEADWRALPRLRVVAGLRADGDSRLREQRAWVDPRLSVFVDVAEGTTLLAAAGLYGSAPAPEETTRSFGSSDLGPQRALHLAAGVRQKLPWDLGLEVTGFYKSMWDLVVPTRATDELGQLQHLSNGGLGKSAGIEVLARRDLSRGLNGWLAYTLSRATRRDDPTMPGHPAWHPFLFDQTHVLTLVLSQRLGRGWLLGARVRAVSGNPYTPTEGAVLDAGSGRYRCIPGPTPYGARMPGFFQADARVDKRFSFRRWSLSMYLDAQNVTNRANAEYWFPSYDCSDQVPIPSVPFLPTFGLRGEW